MRKRHPPGAFNFLHSLLRMITISILVGLFSSRANKIRRVHDHLLARDDPENQREYANQPRRLIAIRLSDDRCQQVVTEYSAGLTTYELAAKYGCHRATISEILKRADVSLRRSSPTSDQVNEMVRLYADGLSLAAVGERLDFSARTVMTYLRERRVPTRDTHGRSQ